LVKQRGNIIFTTQVDLFKGFKVNKPREMGWAGHVARRIQKLTEWICAAVLCFDPNSEGILFEF